MKVFGLILLFLVTLFAALVATMPLGFLLDRTPAKSLGVNWAASGGTIFSGRIRDISAGAQRIGDVQLRLDPMALTSGKIAYRIQWNGDPGSGTANLAVGRDSAAIENLNAVVDIERLVGLANDVRRIGGSASVRSGKVLFARSSCVEASGQVATNVLARAAASYGQSGGDLSGTIACDGPMLSIPLSGSSDEGDTFDAEIRVGLAEPSTFETNVMTINPELSALLSLRGFDRDEDVYSYRRAVQLGGSL